MRILLIIRYFDFGGAENHVLDLANKLQEAGHQIVLVSKKGRQLENLNSGIKHYSLNLSTKKIVFHFFVLFRIVRKHQIEIIHAHQRIPITIASAIRKFCKVKVVATIHSMLRQDVKKRWVRRALDRVIVVSKNSLKGALNDPILKHKSICIPNGITFPEKTNFNVPKKLHVFYVSRFDTPHTKMIVFLLNEIWPTIIRKYPEACFSIIGDGAGTDEIRQIINQIKVPEVSKSILLKGYAPKISKEIINASIVFGVGRVAMESLAMAIPVLSIKSNRLGPIITSKNFERLQYGNFVDVEATAPEKVALLKIIDDFVGNQLYYKAEAIKLQQRLSDPFQINSFIEETIRVYKDVL